MNQKRYEDTVFELSNYPYAKLVTVAGSFNNWNSIVFPLQKKRGRWIGSVSLPKGNHEYKLVVDGVWILDPQNPMTMNNNGKINSLKTIE